MLIPEGDVADMLGLTEPEFRELTMVHRFPRPIEWKGTGDGFYYTDEQIGDWFREHVLKHKPNAPEART